MPSFDLIAAQKGAADTCPHSSRTLLLTWPRWGMWANGRASERRMSALHTSGSGSGSSRNWPTPTASDEFTAKLGSTQQKEGSMHSVTLPQAVEMNWPTPKGSADKYGRPREDDRGDLQRLWRTPQAGEGNGGGQAQTTRESRGHSVYLRDQMKEAEPEGSLNPDWTEALMGIPIGWTDIVGPRDRENPKRGGSRPARSSARRTERADSRPSGTRSSPRLPR